MKELDWLPRKGWMNAAGTAGFIPDISFTNIFPEVVLFSTNPISYRIRNPDKSRNLVTFPGGFWLNTGYPNPGFTKIVKQYGPLWENAILPISVHLILEDPEHTQSMIADLENLQNIFAVEISFNPDFSHNQIMENIDAIHSKIPVILSLAPERLFENWNLLKEVNRIAAICLQPPRGVIFLQDNPVRGRMYGGYTLPFTLNAIRTLKMLEIDLPILAGSGVVSLEDVDHLFEIGVYAFQMHEIAWVGIGFNTPTKL